MNRKKVNSLIIKYPKTHEEGLKHKYKFWSTQPVPSLEDHLVIDKPIANEPPTEKRQLPTNYEWYNVDLTDVTVCDNVAEFLSKYYVENIGNKFKLKFTREFLQWTFVTPRHRPGLAFGVTFNSNLVAFIGATIINIRVGQHTLECAEVKFMCIHSNFRNKSLATQLMKEMRRRLANENITYGHFVTDRYVPKPFFSGTQHHRPLNVRKLVDSEFQILDKTHDIEEVELHFRLPKTTVGKRQFIRMEECHVEEAHILLTDYLEKYNFYQVLTEEEFRHIFLNDHVDCYLLVDADGEILDFASYYKTQLYSPSKDEIINRAQLFYYTTHVETPYAIVYDLLVLAKNNGMDVMSTLEVLENENLLITLNFNPGATKPHYYMYGFQAKKLLPSQVGKLAIL